MTFMAGVIKGGNFLNQVDLIKAFNVNEIQDNLVEILFAQKNPPR